jgi:hypothetical protein
MDTDVRMTWTCVVLAAVLAGTPVVARDGPPATALAPGTMLDQRTAHLATDLLPPEILAHYEKGEYANEIADWPMDVYTWPPDFLAASKSNEARYAVAPEGHIVEQASGTQPEYVIGFPFPTIDPSDPAAGSKILWNHLYRTWYFGNLRAESQLNMISPKGLARRLDVDANFLYFDGVPAAERTENTSNFLVKFLTLVTRPADVNGTAALTWRYREPSKRDSAWTYVPALRRVRAISPANRSDGFLGSDFAQDDGNFFEGKPEDFTWKLVGEKDQLRLADPYNLAGKSDNRWVKDGGGWNAMWPDLPFLGYMDPEWKGVGWAPRTAVLATRRFWVIEGVPKDRYYLFGRLQLYIDKVAYQGAWNRKFSWKDELVITYQVMAYNPHAVARPDGGTDYVQGSSMAFQTAEAIKLNRATAAGIKTTPHSVFHLRVKFDESRFDLDKLAQSGK